MEIILIIAIGIIAIFVVLAIAKLDETVRRTSAINRIYIQELLKLYSKRTEAKMKLENQKAHMTNTNEFWGVKRRLTASRKREEKILRHERIGNASLEETLKVIKKIERKIERKI